ncbi:formylglycine-generating enzyme family protein [Variovorax saccharolyticus]|uniref:formylglycine-generating enzyme family protein n=1 Tax=Variovorax saccharolyticus TaxID=3053516 RepID=UPI002578A346|nr:formylglycine-generating enzyme family protein [Variovorax sp. J22R187]MDM0022450.1 formylglycine-generating enzyme family protein [Variovorax sp. J22R187]
MTTDTVSRPIEAPSAAPHPGMLWIPGGTFRMGSDHHYPEEKPAHRVKVDGFWMDATPITNAQFRAFVEATGHTTFCEIPPNPKDYPGALPEMLKAASSVFVPPPGRVSLHDHFRWWGFVPNANWRQPQGPGSSLVGKDDHPVVHVAWSDVEAYAQWAGKQIPTEAEWEFAARGGLDGAEYAWGDELAPGGVHQANTWQGEFPWQNLAADGFVGTSPVASYASNGWGLYDMTGNVWEWTQTWYAPRHPDEKQKACCIPVNPRGAPKAQSFDPAMPELPIPRKVMKGGSHLCAPNYCRRYRPAARMPQPIDTSTSHLGFRCVVRQEPGA